MRWVRVPILLMFALPLTGRALADEPPRSEPPESSVRPLPPQSPPEPPGDDLRETIALLMMVRMKNELGLSKQQYELIVPKVDERDRTRKAAFEERRTQTIRIRDLLSRESVPDGEFQEAVDRMLALEDADRRKDEAFVSDVRKLLTPRQQAKFILFRQRFRRWLENRVRDARELRAPGARGSFESRRGARGPGGSRGQSRGPDFSTLE